MSPDRKPLARSTVAALTALSVASALGCLWALSRSGWSAPVEGSLAWPIEAGGFFVAQRVVMRIRIRRRVLDFSFDSLAVVLALFVMSPTQLVAAYLGAMAVTLLIERERPIPLIFSLAVHGHCLVVAIAVFYLILGDRAPMGGAAWLASATAMVTANLAVLVGIELRALMLRGKRPAGGIPIGLISLIDVVNATIAFVALRSVTEASWTAAPWLVVGAAIVLGLRSYSGLLHHQESLERFGESTRAVERTRGSGASEQLLEQVIELLAADTGEVALAARNGLGSVVVRMSRDRSVSAWLDRDADPVVAARLTQVPEGSTQVVLARGGREMIAPLWGPDAPLGTLSVTASPGSVFGDQDSSLLTLFANHASVSLYNARLVTTLEAEVEQREHEAMHDHLTSLPNRIMFDLLVRQAIEARTGDELVGVILIDLDRFKEVNDTLGHERGDELLEMMAQRLTLLSRDDRLAVARLGGDEFAVLVQRISEPKVVAALANHVRDTLESPAEIAGVLIDVGASVGVAVAPDDGEDASTLLQRADVAMYLSKQSRHRVVFYSSELDPYSPERLVLAADLRHAVANRQIEAYFQPVASLHTGMPTSVEALARWTHPEFGFIPPDVFIAIAEQSGLIRELTYSMLEQSLQHVRQWRSSGVELKVAVNLSVRMFDDADLVTQVMRYLERAGVEPEWLTLEVTEGTIMDDPERAISVLEQLHGAGISISVDDFGTGYSSLAQLKRLPVSQLKIDRAFVMQLPNDADDISIVQSVIQLGHNLGMRVVAEGVETLESLEYLRQLGCDLVQGYYLSKPVPASDLLRWMLQRPRFAPVVAEAAVSQSG